MNTENPKEEAGRKKCPMHLLPPEALRLAALVHQHGAEKYTAFNWRHAGINATTYIGAIMRHLTAWADGEDNDPETGLSHIAHIVAGCNIVMDAQSLGMMNDDRSKKPTASEAAERMSRSVLREVTPGKPIPVARMTAPSDHRWVVKGEILRKGDKYLSDITGKWTEISYPIGEPASSNGAYIRKIWTAVGPNTNYVTVEKEISRIEGTRRWLEVNMPDGFTPLPAPPEGYDVWVYRGLGWQNRDESSPILYLSERTHQWEETIIASGVPYTHYVEAIKQ